MFDKADERWTWLPATKMLFDGWEACERDYCCSLFCVWVRLGLWPAALAAFDCAPR